jgi:superfamily I DNA/RNA helicase
MFKSTKATTVEEYLDKGTSPKKIGYFAFTKKAAEEALQRAKHKFGLDDKDLPYFRTLHSLAFRVLGISKNQVMKKYHYQDLGQKLGFSVAYASYQDDFGGYFSSDSDYLNLISLARVRGISIEEQFDLNEHDSDIERDKLIIIAQELERYKKELGLIDFTDMISKFINKDASPSFDVVFIDEAQDLSYLQWLMVRQIWNKSEDAYVAGDVAEPVVVFHSFSAAIAPFYVRHLRVMDHGLPGQFRVKVPDAFDVGVGKQRSCVRSDHTVPVAGADP